MTPPLDENSPGLIAEGQDQLGSVEPVQQTSTVERSFDMMSDDEKTEYLSDWFNTAIVEDRNRYTGDAEYLDSANASKDDKASQVNIAAKFQNEIDKAKDEGVASMQAAMKGEPPTKTPAETVPVQAVNQNGQSVEAELVEKKPEEPLAVAVDTSPILENVRDAVAEFTEEKAQRSIDKQTLKPNLAEPFKYPETPKPITEKKEFIPGVRAVREKVTAFVSEKLNTIFDPKRVEKINAKLEALKEKATHNASELGFYQKQQVEIDSKILKLEEQARKQKISSAESKRIKAQIDGLLFQKTNVSQMITTESINAKKINSQLEKVAEKHAAVTERFNARIEKQKELLRETESFKKSTQDTIEEYKMLLAKYTKELQDLTNNPRIAQKNKERITQLKRFISNEETFLASTPARMVAYDEMLAQRKQFIKDLENQRDNVTVQGDIVVPPPIPEPTIETAPQAEVKIPSIPETVKNTDFEKQNFVIPPEPVSVPKPEKATKPEKTPKPKIVSQPEDDYEDNAPHSEKNMAAKKAEVVETQENKIEMQESYKDTLGEYVDKWNEYVVDKKNKKVVGEKGYVYELDISPDIIKSFNESHSIQVKTDSKINPDIFGNYLRHSIRSSKDKKIKTELNNPKLSVMILDFSKQLKK